MLSAIIVEQNLPLNIRQKWRKFWCTNRCYVSFYEV